MLPRSRIPKPWRDLAADCDAIMTNWAKVPEPVIAAAPRCKIIARLGIGLDNIDVAAATRRGIVVTNVPDYCVIEVAEHALALLLALSRKVPFYHHETKSGRYNLQAGPQLRRIEGQTLGILGLGNIGRRLAEKAAALGLSVLATGRTPRANSQLPAGVTWTNLDDLLSRSDYISLHVPLTPETKHVIGASQFARMKPSAYLINTSRGGLIDHAALFSALNAGQLAGAALDVQDPEPPDLSQPPFNDPRVVVTPARCICLGRIARESPPPHRDSSSGLSAGQHPRKCCQPKRSEAVTNRQLAAHISRFSGARQVLLKSTVPPVPPSSRVKMPSRAVHSLLAKYQAAHE